MKNSKAYNVGFYEADYKKYFGLTTNKKYKTAVP